MQKPNNNFITTQSNEELQTLATNLRLEIYRKSFLAFPDRKHYESLLNKLILEQSIRLRAILSIPLGD